MTECHVSSSASTGGTGTFFEQNVAAYWMAQLLVRGIPPVLIETIVLEVNFQTEVHGWHTDDFLVVCEGHGAVEYKLIGQVKRSFSVSAADEECKKTIQDFWKDYKNTSKFSRANDRLVLVTQRGTNTLLEHFVGLLDCARAAHDAAEFDRRLRTKGFISKKAAWYCGELCTIISDIEGGEVAAADIWPFLRLLYVLSLDLYTSTRQTEAQIKNMLAHTVTEGDASGVAAASWNTLLALASTAMSEAHSLRRADLPVELQQRHEALGTNEQRILCSLRDHTSPVLRKIRSTIGGDFHLQRAALVQKVLSELENAQVVIVSGPAGSGKSVIGKDSLSLLSPDHFVFGFRVEEFAQAHIDATLNAGQIPANAETLAAILAAQGRKIVLVESVERLLEKTTRDAFSDLIALAAADCTMYIILTCRDYSIEQVCASFLRPAGISHVIVSVPPLEDTELAEVEKALPALAFPLKNPPLRNILRNPYFLDKALEISWSAARPVPESEREFRTIFWRQIVCAEQKGPAGMARRREDVFQKIAVRRARALSPYIICSDLDPEVVAILLQDSLIVSSDENPLLLATAHDVLEDWAILQWLEEQHLTNEGTFKDLSAAIGAHPAIRRSYRKWIAELVERDPDAADHLFRAAISETEISIQFRDDTLVSLLKAPSSAEFLTQHEVQLLANDKTILKRVIHLLRVACVTTPAWFTTDAAGVGSIFNVPDGPAWAAIMEIVQRNIVRFTPQERPLLLGMIEDAVRGVSWREPELNGAKYVADISYWLLTGLDYYQSEEACKRVLRVIAKIPKADTARFESLLRGTVKEGQRRDHIAEDFREILYSGMEGVPAARDLPELVISVATDYLLASEDDLRRDRYFGSSIELETHFGIKEGLRHDFFPASAYRGPWITLLNCHSRMALDFFINVFNHSANWYVHPRVHNPPEPAWEIELTFSDGTIRKQWGNPRLWNLYRGTTVGPYVLQSLLMAFEKWLLGFATYCPEQLNAVLLDILRRSESAALTAVVASVATAHPHISGEALLVLLSAPTYIVFDRSRMASESQASALSGVFPQLQPDNKIYEEERKEADQLKHRCQDLESAIMNLQLGPLVSRVHTMLDQYRAVLRPVPDQNDEDKIWRLAIDRMDLRRYTISEVSSPATVTVTDPAATETQRRSLRFDPDEPEPDLKEMMDESAVRFGAINARMGLLMWAYQIFNHDNTGTYNPAMWHQRLLEAQSKDTEVTGDADILDLARGGPGIVAAVCVRDHWEDMSNLEREWCIEKACSEVIAHACGWNHIERVQRYNMAADRACVRVLPMLLAREITEVQLTSVESAFVAALTHPIDEVRWYVVWGIAEHLWSADRALSIRCVNAIAMEATIIDTELRSQEGTPYHQRRRTEDIEAEAAMAVRHALMQPDGVVPDAYENLDVSEWFGVNANGRILTILSNAPDDPIAVAGYTRAAQTLVKWWDADDDRKQGHRHRERNHDSETAISQRLQNFVMRTSAESARLILQPILGAINRHPRKIHWIIQGLTGIEDKNPNTSHYWCLWELFAEGVKNAKWIARLDGEYPIGSEMLSAIFLTSWWKDNVRHWRSLEGNDYRIHTLYEALPPLSIVLDDYVRFLYHIGEQSLPAAFIRIADSLRHGDAQAMLAKTNTVFLLEVLLQRHVYGKPLELKRESSVRQGVLFLLDMLVEAGSSSAFRMRDDFVTPISTPR